MIWDIGVEKFFSGNEERKRQLSFRKSHIKPEFHHSYFDVFKKQNKKQQQQKKTHQNQKQNNKQMKHLEISFLPFTWHNFYLHTFMFPVLYRKFMWMMHIWVLKQKKNSVMEA